MSDYANEQREERETEKYVNRYAERARREQGDAPASGPHADAWQFIDADPAVIAARAVAQPLADAMNAAARAVDAARSAGRLDLYTGAPLLLALRAARAAWLPAATAALSAEAVAYAAWKRLPDDEDVLAASGAEPPTVGGVAL